MNFWYFSFENWKKINKKNYNIFFDLKLFRILPGIFTLHIQRKMNYSKHILIFLLISHFFNFLQIAVALCFIAVAFAAPAPEPQQLLLFKNGFHYTGAPSTLPAATLPGTLPATYYTRTYVPNVHSYTYTHPYAYGAYGYNSLGYPTLY